MNYLKREHIRKETERAWTTTLNLCFQQIGVNLFIGWCFLGDWKAREKLELWLLHPYTIFFLYRHLQLQLCLRSWQNFMGPVLGWYWLFWDAIIQPTADRNKCLPLSPLLLSLKQSWGWLHQNPHEETNTFMFWSHWKFLEWFKRLAEVLMQVEINAITQSTHEGIVCIFNRSAPWCTATF